MSEKRAGRLRWKRKQRPKGLLGMTAGEMGSDLHDGVNKYATTYKHKHKDGWYWVARCEERGVAWVNTCEKKLATEEEAKEQAMAYVKEQLAKAGGTDGDPR